MADEKVSQLSLISAVAPTTLLYGVDVSGSNPASVGVRASQITAGLSLATTSLPGLLSAADKTTLTNATNVGTAGTLVLRDGSGNATFNKVLLTTGSITGTPTNATDIANKSYVDAAAAGLHVLTPAGAATTANVSLTGSAPNTVDGVSLTTATRILVKSQSDATQNGIYVPSVVGTGSNGTWVRSSDANTTGQLVTGSYVFITGGTTNINTAYVINTIGTITIGTSNIVWTVFSQVSSISAASITGQLTASQIGSVNAGTIVGNISAGNINSVNASAINGSINSANITSVNAGSITGAILSGQLVPGIMNSLNLIANSLMVVQQVSSLPSLPNTDYPVNSTVLLTSTKTLYKNVSGTWTVQSASSTLTGTLTSSDIGSVNAGVINGFILSGQIQSIDAGKITGSISATNITSVNASAINGSISATNITSVNATSINIGTLQDSQIGSVSAGKISAGTVMAGVEVDIGTGYNQAKLTSSVFSYGGAFQLTSPVSGLVRASWYSGSGGPTASAITIQSIFTPAAAQINGYDASGNARFTLTNFGVYAFNDGVANAGLLSVDAGSGHVTFGSTSNTTVALITNNTAQWFINGASGALKSVGTNNIQKASSDGWTTPLFDGGNTVEFQWNGSTLYARIGGSGGPVVPIS